MKSIIVIFVLLVAALNAPMANASPIYYTFNFFSSTGILPTDGSFTYDDETPVFTDFFLTFNGVLVNLTDSANNPMIGGFSVPCLNSQTGAAASFLLLSGACNVEGSITDYFPTLYGMPYPGKTGVLFEFMSFDTINNSYIDISFHGGVTDWFPGGKPNGGTWTINRIPEPSSLLLLGLGLAGVFAVKFREEPLLKPKPQL